MTLSDTIRKILAKAPGPMSFGDIRAEISDSVAGNNISGTLFALAKSGEVIKERTGADGSGHFTYLLDPSQKPARAGKRVPPPAATSSSEAEAPARAASSRPRKVAKRTVAKALAAVAAASTAEPTAQPDPASITLPAWVVRMLCGTALICGRDMTAAEHDALREATQLALRAA